MRETLNDLRIDLRRISDRGGEFCKHKGHWLRENFDLGDSWIRPTSERHGGILRGRFFWQNGACRCCITLELPDCGGQRTSHFNNEVRNWTDYGSGS